ncbi:VOC family protein [Cytobacillus sp. Hz8]|uniref:VOC family protein n=1 Tax=Cytobacillus sp. Hz8 TaxID=3347168 RepID=UPI0035D6220A
MKCDIKSLYICVLDMERAISFYEAFFEQKVAVKDNVYSIFDINGFRFGLFAFEKMKEKHSFGNNCLPSVSVESVNIFNQKLKGLKIVFPATKIGENWVAEFEDSEGNHIELTTPIDEWCSTI